MFGGLPRKVNIAVSGGLDSMVALDFFKNNHEVKAIHVVYGDLDEHYNKEVISLICNYCKSWDIPFKLYHQPYEVTSNKEKVWRDLRYETFKTLDTVTVLGHNLNDAAETYLMSCITGTPKHMGFNGPSNTVRPFLLTSRKLLEDYANKNKVSYIEDPDNSNYKLLRPNIRHKLLPKVLEVNPNFLSVVRNQLLIKGKQHVCP
jgi:tRNA(Ile)-lysidine synthase